MPPTFCTYFDHNYLPRGMALYDSLKRHCPDAVLHVLALSEDCERLLGQWNAPDLVVTPLRVLEAYDPELAATKGTRSQVEYYFTQSPCWPLYLFDTCSEIDVLTYVDADCGIFADPSPVLAEMDGLSVGMVGHRFAERMRHLEIWGRYNVGWISFKRDEDGLACLRWWRERCLEWCEDRLDGDRFADQKYLDKWPELFSGTAELRSAVVNVAPWNVERFTVVQGPQGYTIDGVPLVCYHFHGCKRLLGPIWDTSLSEYDAPLPPSLRALYREYVSELQAWEQRLAAELPEGFQSQRHRHTGLGLRMALRRARQVARNAWKRTLFWNF